MTESQDRDGASGGERRPGELTTANDRLLKAVIVLWALRDGNFLHELQTVFAMAAREGGLLGCSSEGVWTEIREELKQISDFVASESPDLVFHS